MIELFSHGSCGVESFKMYSMHKNSQVAFVKQAFSSLKQPTSLTPLTFQPSSHQAAEIAAHSPHVQTESTVHPLPCSLLLFASENATAISAVFTTPILKFQRQRVQAPANTVVITFKTFPASPVSYYLHHHHLSSRHDRLSE